MNDRISMKNKPKSIPPIQEWQRRRIFGLGKRLGLDLDGLRMVAAQYNGGYHHLTKLNYETARKMINDLARQVKSRRKNEKWISPAQKEYIKSLYGILGWNEYEFNAWLSRFHSFRDINAPGITLQKAQNIIEGLKAMAKRKIKKENELMEMASAEKPAYA